MKFAMYAFFLMFIISLTAHMSVSDYHGDEVKKSFAKKGYYEFAVTDFDHDFYDSVYKAFDDLLEDIKHDPLLKSKLSDATVNFTRMNAAKIYANAPIGLVDFTVSGKIDKDFFHFTAEFLNYLKSSDEYRVLLANSNLSRMLNDLSRINEYSRKIFHKTITSLSHTYPRLSNEFGQTIPILTKIVRYRASDKEASHAHYDFSAFTVMLHNTDDSPLLISSYAEPPMEMKQLQPIFRKIVDNSKQHSALLIPGIALSLFGCADLKPTPHSVLPLKQVRHAIIVFAMLPERKIDYSQIRVPMRDKEVLTDEKKKDL